jgi:hypothetical protein
MAVEAASETPTKKLSKGKKAQREARPGEFGAKVLAAAKHLSVKNAAASEKGEIEAQLLTQASGLTFPFSKGLWQLADPTLGRQCNMQVPT